MKVCYCMDNEASWMHNREYNLHIIKPSYINTLQLELGKTKRFEFAKAKANLDAKKTSGGELKANLTHFFSRHFLILLSRFFLFKKQIFECYKPFYCTQKIT